MSADDSNEARARAIFDQARSQRRRSSRTVWLVALSIGGACVLGFVLVMIALIGSPGASSSGSRSQTSDHSFGFAIGLTAGLVIGIAIGFAIARQRQVSSESSAPHSDDSSP